MLGATIETYSVMADYREGKITVYVYTGTQSTFAQRVIIADVFELPYSKVRIIQANIGGSFGSKVVAVGASLKFGRPIKVTMNIENIERKI